MKAISTKYHGPSSVKGSRYSATDSDRNRVILSSDHSLRSKDNHIRAARKLCEKMDWHGTLVYGYTKDGMVFVFSSESDPIEV